MASKTKANQKKSKFEYKPDIYDEESKFTEQDYWDIIGNKDAEILDLRDFDLRALSSELYN